MSSSEVLEGTPPTGPVEGAPATMARVTIHGVEIDMPAALAEQVGMDPRMAESPFFHEDLLGQGENKLPVGRSDSVRDLHDAEILCHTCKFGHIVKSPGPFANVKPDGTPFRTIMGWCLVGGRRMSLDYIGPTFCSQYVESREARKARRQAAQYATSLERQSAGPFGFQTMNAGFVPVTPVGPSGPRAGQSVEFGGVRVELPRSIATPAPVGPPADIPTTPDGISPPSPPSE